MIKFPNISSFSSTLRMMVSLIRGQSKEVQAEAAYRLGYSCGEAARGSKNWIDDEVTDFSIENSDDLRQGLIDGFDNNQNRHEADQDRPQEAVE